MLIRPIPIFLYHKIAVPPVGRVPYRSMTVHPDKFRNQMHWLHRLGFQGMSLRSAMPYLLGQKQGKVAVISFDDGFLSVYDHAMPVLDELGFTATNYFVANQIGGYNAWDIPLGVAPEPCMSLSQMRHWHENGHEVGAHTLDHLNMAKVEPDVARQQISDCKPKLEDMLGSEVTSFAFPFGGETPATRIMAAEAGYSNAVTTQKRRARHKDDLFGLPRLTIRRNDTTLHFLKKCFAR